MSPALAASKPGFSDDEEEEEFNRQLDGAGSDESWDGDRADLDRALPDPAIMEEESPDTGTPFEGQEGMLPRDIQKKTAYYDYAAEKSLSQADAKLFYQRSQMEGQATGGSNWGNSQASAHGSPNIMPRSFSNVFAGDGTASGIARTSSVKSMQSAHHT